MQIRCLQKKGHFNHDLCKFVIDLWPINNVSTRTILERQVQQVVVVNYQAVMWYYCAVNGESKKYFHEWGNGKITRGGATSDFWDSPQVKIISCFAVAVAVAVQPNVDTMITICMVRFNGHFLYIAI
jgi:hypothetical protein